MERLRKLIAHQGLKKYFSNSAWMLVEQFVAMGVAFVVGLYVARYLGKQEFGRLNYCMVLVGFIAPFIKLGTRQVLSKRLVLAEQPAVTLGTAMVAQLASWCVLGILVLGVGWVLMVPEKLLLVGVIYLSSGFFVGESIEQYFKAKTQAKFVSIAGVGSILVGSAFRLYLVFSEQSLVYFAWAIVLEMGLRALLLAILFQGYSGVSLKYLGCSRAELRGILEESWPFILTATMTGIYMRIDQVMIMHLLGEEANGVYAAASKLFRLFALLPLIYVQSFFPALVRAEARSKRAFDWRMRTSYLLVTGYGFLALLVVALWADELVFWTFGEDYRATATLLPWMIAAASMAGIGLLSEKWILIHKLQKYSLVTRIVAAALNVVLNFVLIRAMGLVGAAVATFVAQVCSVWLSALLWKEPRENFVLFLTSWRCLRRDGAGELGDEK